jgi:hypothetical protein
LQSTDIPQVACRLIARSADFAARSSDLHSKPRLRSPERSNVGGIGPQSRVILARRRRF